MARLFHSGAEIDAAAYSFTPPNSGPDGLNNGLGATSRDTTLFRSGVASWKFDSGASNLSGFGTTPITYTDGRTYYTRVYINTSLGNGGTTAILGFGVTGSGIAIVFSITGTLQLWANLLQSGSDSVAINDAAWHRIELSATATATGNWTAAEFRLDGVSVATWSGSFSRAASTQFYWGWSSQPGANKAFNMDDLAVNDSTGTVNNTFAGDGKVVLLKPVSDNAVGTGWTLGTGTATGGNAHTAVANTPPLGSADTSVGSDVKQIRNATSNANVNYDANMTTYTAAGIVAADTIHAVVCWVATAAPVLTSAKAGTVGVVSNPAIANVSLGATGTAGAFWSGAAASTYIAGWKWSSGTMTETPTVTLGTAPVMRITQVTSSTRIAVVCAMFMYVEYTPAAIARQPRSPAIDFADPALY